MNEQFTGWLTTHSLPIIFIVAVTGAIYYIGAIFMSQIIRRALHTSRHRNWHEKDIEKRQNTLVGLFRNVWRVLAILIAAYYIVQNLIPTINYAPLFASAGILGVALGFGAQSLVKDFLSGVFIISENQYRVGDIIEIDGSTGTVERIGTRSTVIRDADGNVHYFPNGMVQHVVNKTMGYSMARFSIGVHPSSDLDTVIALINNTGQELAKEEKWKNKVLEPPAFVSVGEFTATSVTLMIAGKCQPSDQWSITAEMRQRLLIAFENQGILLSAATTSPTTKAKKK